MVCVQVNEHLQSQVTSLQDDNSSFQSRVTALQETTASLSVQISALAQQAQSAASTTTQLQVSPLIARRCLLLLPALSRASPFL